jgi:hypothetical protein
MSEFQPQQFSFLYANDKAPGSSLDEKVGLKTCEGHVLRCSQTGKFLYFPDIITLNNYFVEQAKPYLHSVINKHRPVRFNLELDMPVELLDNIVFPKATLVKIEADGLDLNLIKSLKALEHVQDVIFDVLEEFGIEMSEYKFLTASDNRKEKFSYRMYLKLAFENMREYKHFITQLKDRVRPEILPMIDPTSLMLRTPGSYKDQHMAKWVTPCAIEEAILSYTDNCDMIEPRAPAEEPENKFDELTTMIVKKAAALIATHPAIQKNFYYAGENKGLLCLKRIQPSHCEICDRIHDVSDAYVTIYRGNVHLRCYRDDTKGCVFLGFVGEAEPMQFRWADVKALMKAQDKLKDTGMSNKEMKGLVTEQKKLFAEAKKAAGENDAIMKKVKKFYFTDHKDFHKKTFTDDTYVTKYIRQSIAKIAMGGNSLFITSDEWKNTKHFTEMSMLPCSTRTESYWYSIINPTFDPDQPIDVKKNPMTLKKILGDTINDVTMMEFYKAVDFVPYLIPPTEKNKEIFNMFEGYRFPYVEQKEPEPSVERWVDHILNVVCCGNADQAKTLTQWFAHIIQKPTEKAFAVILYAGQGTGKSILYEFFTRCIGKDLGLQVGKLEDLTQTHNTHLRGKLIINANEATNEPCLRDVNILKGLITETDLIINPKGVNQYTVSNYSRLMITSNYKHCMRFDADDRRYFCLEVSDHMKQNDVYFAPLIADLTNEANQQDFFNYLANYDISDFKHQRPPLSKMKRELIEDNASNIVSFVKDVCENNIFSIPFEEATIEIFVSLKDLYEEYDLWCRQNDARGRKSSREGLHAPMFACFKIKKSQTPRPARKEGFVLNRTLLLPHFREAYAKPDFEFIVAE